MPVILVFFTWRWKVRNAAVLGHRVVKGACFGLLGTSPILAYIINLERATAASVGVSSALLSGVLFVTSSSYPGADCKDTGLSREVKGS